MRSRLSVAIITLNEEERLRACLEGVAWVDEIVVVDAGSSDKTAEIAREFTDRVLFHAWEGYAAQKNYALTQCGHPWLLSLDADELVSPELRAEIEAVLEHDGPADGYEIPRKNFFLGRFIRHGTWYPDYQLRLFRRGRGAFQPASVHESVRVDGRTTRLRAPLIHQSYRSIEEFVARANRYSTLAAEELAARGQGGRWGDLLLRPAWRFFSMYLLHRGFLDGWRGLLLAALYAHYVFLRAAKAREAASRKVSAPDGGAR